MNYRRLGKSNLKVSVVGIGSWQFGGEWGKQFTPAEVDRILGRARDLDINLIDTAACYGDHLSESLIGPAVKKDRDRWLIASKFGHKFHANFDRTDHWEPQQVRSQLEASLKALGTDYIDLYQFHSGTDQAFDTEGLWEMLNEQVKAGKIRHLGISLSSRIDPTHQTTLADQVGASTIQVVYNRLDQSAEEKVLPLCQKQDLGVLPRIPLASGFLSGKYLPGTEFNNPDDVRTHQDKAKVQRNLELAQEIRRIEVPEGVDMAAWALAWCLQNPAVTCVIPGCKSVEQVEKNASAAELSMVSDDHPQAWP